MKQTRLYQNSGSQMFADDPAELNDLELGIVMLYADTATGRVCSYLRARHGQPIQATVECTFEDVIDLTSIESVIDSTAPNRFELEHAPMDDPTDRRWALQGLRSTPVELPDSLLEGLRILLDPDQPTPGVSSGSLFENLTHEGRVDDEDPQVDLAVRNIRDASRLFRSLVEELGDLGVTIAVSKSGRIDCLSETDVVVHIDGSVSNRDTVVVPHDDTAERLAHQQAILRQRWLSRAIHGHVDNVVEAYSDERESMPADHEDLAESVLRKELRSALGGVSDLTVVPVRSRWTRPLAAGVSGLGLGLVGGFFGAGWISAAAATIDAQLRPDLLWALGAITTAIQPSEVRLYGTVAVCSVALLVGSVLLKRRMGSDIDRDLSSTSAREDLLAKVLRLAVIISAGALLGSIAMLTYGG